MKKGFTLIELLAVIVILAIIALIATPTILGVVENARKGSAESSALGYIDAVEKQVMINELDGNDATNILDNVYEISDLDAKKVTVKGQKPSAGWVQIEKGQVVDYSFKIGNYYVNPSENNSRAVANKNGSLKTKPSGTPVVSGPTKVNAEEGETHKGIVYLDPTNISAECNASNSVSTTEVKTGCMKWYIFDDSGDNYTMILDHNTTARIKWNDDKSNVAYESSNLKAVVDDLVTTSGWEVTPRLITADEVNTITGKTGFDASSTSSWYYFDDPSKGQTHATFSESVRSSYDWLYNNLNKCKTDSTDHGCTIEDGNTHSGYGTVGEGKTWAYWTSTPVGTAGSGSSVWRVTRTARLLDSIAANTDGGVRPVITLSKSVIS